MPVNLSLLKFFDYFEFCPFCKSRLTFVIYSPILLKCEVINNSFKVKDRDRHFFEIDILTEKVIGGDLFGFDDFFPYRTENLDNELEFLIGKTCKKYHFSYTGNLTISYSLLSINKLKLNTLSFSRFNDEYNFMINNNYIENLTKIEIIIKNSEIKNVKKIQNQMIDFDFKNIKSIDKKLKHLLLLT